jgi:hypothetical protein
VNFLILQLNVFKMSFLLHINTYLYKLIMYLLLYVKLCTYILVTNPHFSGPITDIVRQNISVFKGNI